MHTRHQVPRAPGAPVGFKHERARAPGQLSMDQDTKTALAMRGTYLPKLLLDGLWSRQAALSDVVDPGAFCDSSSAFEYSGT